MCFIGAIGSYAWLSSFGDEYIMFIVDDVHKEAFPESLLTFWTNIIIFQIMIPISLYVTIELCKVLQVFHIHNNLDLFDDQTNKRTVCRAMNITEELGQVQHIFSDKTGTLTENKMLFRKCTVNGADYNHAASELEKDFLKPGAPLPPIMINSHLVDDMVASYFSSSYTKSAERIQEFFLVLSICNTVIVSETPHRDTMNASGMIETPRSIPRSMLNGNNGVLSGNKSYFSLIDSFQFPTFF